MQTPARDDALTAFQQQRPRLLGVSYRILGSVVDAEDVVQDAWLRWAATDTAEVDNPAAFLTTVVTRLSIDRLRRVKAQRELYPGPWLPEPVAVDGDPVAAAELADSLSMALLVVLETLTPLERAAFVLRDVFDEPYRRIATILGRDETAVRQLVHRGRRHVDERRTRFTPTASPTPRSWPASPKPAAPPTWRPSWTSSLPTWFSSVTAAASPPRQSGRSTEATRWRAS